MGAAEHHSVQKLQFRAGWGEKEGKMIFGLQKGFWQKLFFFF